jgi:acetolactate synthase-1/2/3 large subunit
MNGAELLVKTAVECGVRICFANPGTTEIPIVTALDTVRGLKPVLGLFEGVCTGAADGYGRVTMKPAMTLLHLVPGFANGIACLHNARRCRTPVLNVVGEHATWHLQNDPPLAGDLAGLTAVESAWLRTSATTDAIGRDLADAVAAARLGRIATLIVPNDLQQAEAAVKIAQMEMAAPRAIDGAVIDEAARLLKGARKAALFMGGPALRAAGLEAAARVRAACGCDLLTDSFPPFMDRGAGLPPVRRIAYFPEPALKLLAEYDAFVLVGASVPVSFFGYPGVPGRLIADGQATVDIGVEDRQVVEALHALADALGAQQPDALDAALRAAYDRPAIPSGQLTPEKLCLTLAALQPEDAIIVDEGLTTAMSYYGVSAGVPRHSLTTIVGGAIGYGMPCALGAALAAPGRKVINLQADGSALYTVQALWSQAREGVDVTTLVCSNRSYRIVEVELARAGIERPGPAASELTRFHSPPIHWVELSEGFGVPAVSVDTCEDLALELRRALAASGPHLIEMRV